MVASSYNPTKVLRHLAAFNRDFEGREEQVGSFICCV